MKDNGLDDALERFSDPFRTVMSSWAKMVGASLMEDVSLHDVPEGFRDPFEKAVALGAQTATVLIFVGYAFWFPWLPNPLLGTYKTG